MKTFFSLMSTVIFTTVISQHPGKKRTAIPCNSGFTAIGAYCYKLFRGLTKWEDAKTNCENQGWTLAETKSLSENSAVHQVMKVITGLYVWLGGDDRGTEDDWLWSQQTIGWTNWGTSEPNGGQAQNCLVMHKSTGGWHDAFCTSLASYVCQYKQILPTTTASIPTTSEIATAIVTRGTSEFTHTIPTESIPSESTDTIIIIVAAISALLLICCISYAAFAIKKKCDNLTSNHTTTTTDTTTHSSGGKDSSEGTSSDSGKASSEGQSSGSSGNTSSSDGTGSSKDSHST